ncbi:hypothetical protein V7266_29885 [Neobacillus drentensis]|uniref:hypothetical protein n=1 Tax=Neobacillus drentensis TaxID=220684 RepID=UPI002FFF86DE
MKLLGLVLVLALALTACNETDTTKNQLKDNNINTTKVSDNAKVGKGQKYGGKRTGYGQVKKNEPGQATPPIIEAPMPAIEWTDETMTQDWIKWAKSQGQYTTEGHVNTSQNAGWIYAVGMQPWFDNTAINHIESTYKLNVTNVEHRTMPDGQPETIFYVTK